MERRRIGRVLGAGRLMGRMIAKNRVMAHRKRRRRKTSEAQKDAAKEQKGLEEIQVELAGPFLFGEGSWGPCRGGKAGPCGP